MTHWPTHRQKSRARRAYRLYLRRTARRLRARTRPVAALEPLT